MLLYRHAEPARTVCMCLEMDAYMYQRAGLCTMYNACLAAGQRGCMVLHDFQCILTYKYIFNIYA
jgi:hypothetical protein